MRSLSYYSVAAFSFLLACVIACCEMGCNTTKTEQKTEEVKEVSGGDVTEVEFRGHIYIIYDGYRQGGITHAGHCPCHSKGEEQ